MDFLKSQIYYSSIFEFIHNELSDLFEEYMRLGGMRRILDLFIEGHAGEIPETVASLASTIEENVKVVLGDKISLYEYEDVLRNLAIFGLL